MKKETRVPGDADRDQSIDRLLKTTLGATLTPAAPECVDAETLAAWAAGSLAAAEADAVEQHLSTCARCQAMVAAFARTEPVATVIPFRPRQPLRWLLPLAVAAAAAVAVIWIALPRPQIAPSSSQQVAKADTPASLPAPVTLAEQKAAQPPGNRPAEPAAPAQAVPPVAAPKLQAVTPPPPTGVQPPPALIPLAPPPPPPAVQPPATPPVTTQNQAGAASAALPPAPPARPPATSVGLTTADAGRVTGLANRPTATADQLTALAIVEIVAPSAPEAQLVGGGAGAAGGAGGGGRGGGGGAGRGVAARAGGQQAQAAAPPANPPARWRILPAGQVERSLDAGATWQPIAIDPPATLTGGVATSSTICWLIGRGGAILRTVDGNHFERLKFPETVDLSSIRSTGASQATVTTADGRVFVTIDGGLTWRLQGFPASSF